MLNTLAAQQAGLKRAIVTGVRPADAPDTAGLLRATEGREPLLRIYRQAYAGRFIAALRDNFGVLPRVLGDEAFDALALAYIQAYPSTQPSIRWFGHRLPGFMAEHDDLVPHPALTDLARMEWALRAAFDAADREPIDAQALAGVAPDAWPSLVFDALPGVQLFDLGWNVAPVWRAMQDGVDGEWADLREPQPLAHSLLVWRAGLDTRWRSLEPLPARLLHAALQGQNFGTLCALAANAVGEAQAALHAASALRGWLADGLFSGWRTPTADA
jgi:hypothetical protein